MHLRSKSFWPVSWTAFSVISARLVLLVCIALANTCSLEAEDKIKTFGWPEVSLNVIALDHQNGVIRSLSPENLVVKENGTAQTITKLSNEDSPASVCILVDVSSSMKPFAAEERRIAARIVQEANPEDEFCIVSFQFRTIMEHNFTKDRSQLVSALKPMEFGGATAYRDGIQATAKYMRQYASNETRIMVIITDGVDNASDVSPSKLEQDLKADGSMLCVLAVAAQGDNGVYDAIRRNLGGSVKATGGLIFYADNFIQMGAVTDQMSEAIRGRYKLTYTSTNVDRNGKMRSLEVTPIKTPSGLKKMSLHAPKGYYAPSQ
jgi:VWFA-related protein